METKQNFNSMYHIPERSAPEPKYVSTYADGRSKHEGDEDEYWTQSTKQGCFSNVPLQLCQKCGETLTVYGDCFACGTMNFEQEQIIKKINELADEAEEIQKIKKLFQDGIESQMHAYNLLWAFAHNII
jgi:hypothetical protein